MFGRSTAIAECQAGRQSSERLFTAACDRGGAVKRKWVTR
ncbi:hypothetical protein TcasGA2_TC031405 [Tribolium castaneum]|uniref:Uncharacterized protein n=1 Tax=Tribolium castaneum TaxID=7070 RepID=A0A139WAQ7_TRICA|nr:hypothetical protein TcasGA2_TC031405 [Tribolium castaneum]